ncbi:MAG: SUMF1/EgtB/PvdO family nonheme iron enzyme [Geminicoccaceae bacterium]
MSRKDRIDWDAIDRMLAHPTEDFVTLAEAAGLDLATDFVRADLCNVDFGYCDLAGFNFEGANLDGADLSRATVDKAKWEGIKGEPRWPLGSEPFRDVGAEAGHTPYHIEPPSASRQFALAENDHKPFEYRRSPEAELWPPGRVFRDIDEPWCPEMVVIPAGSFVMGSPENERGRMHNEGPQHQVTFARSFALGRYPITFDEFDSFCLETGRKQPPDEAWGRGRRPVTNVSFADAEGYLLWLTKKTGRRYRLPSEAEWEYACRAGTTTRYAFGDRFSHSRAHASVASMDAIQHDDEILDFKTVGCTAKVGSYPSNSLGLYDMHGNVGEWCGDNYHLHYEDAPTDGSAWLEGGTVTGAPVRGGSWLSIPEDCRSANRHGPTRAGQYNSVGFRVARAF